MVEDSSSSQVTKCGYVAVVGSPNVGKSTLVNALVGSKVSIVSPKVQTTRSSVNGIMMEDNVQAIFTDTPGVFAAKKRLDKAIVRSAWQGLENADLVLMVLDARHGYDDEAKIIMERLRQCHRKAILVLNKIDVAPRNKILDVAEELFKQDLFDEVFMVSAKRGQGLDDLKKRIKERLPEGSFLYPEDQLSDLPQRLFAAEITREKLFFKMQQEIPYSLTVETEKWEDMPDGSVKINQVIYVQKEGQRAIVLGNKGAMIKQVSMAARQEMESLFGHRVHLFLFVKVRKDWTEDPSRYREWGLDFNA